MTMELPFAFSTKLKFYVNGRKIIEQTPNPESNLLQYLRNDLGLTGSKLGCGEGGCGACTVMISRFDPQQKKIKHCAETACLIPLCSVDGLAITTIEGIGSTKTKLHPLQESLVRNHGSQCGFCSPGMLMSMYTLLRNKPTANQIDLQRACEGNLCRCTGYRSIIAGFEGCNMENCCMKANIPKENALNGISGTAVMNGICEEKQSVVSSHLDNTQDIIFPPELMLSESHQRKALHVEGENITWTRPVTLDQLLQAKKLYPEAKLVAGNTSVGQNMRDHTQRYHHFICITDVLELNVIQEDDDGYTFGSAVTIASMEETFKESVEKLPESLTQVYAAIIETFHGFGNTQIRNRATIGGHIIAGLAASDLNPILICAGCTVSVISLQGVKRSIQITKDFFENLESGTSIRFDEIVLSVSIPFTQQGEHFHVFKQGNRRFGSSAIVNAAMRVKFKANYSHNDASKVEESDIEDMWFVEDLGVVYGGLYSTPLVATRSTDALVGRPWNRTNMANACQMLERELIAVVAQESENYKVSLAVSFLFKFFNVVLSKTHLKKPFSQNDVQQIQTSAIIPKKRKKIRSQQTHKASIENAIVGKPIAHVSSQMQVTGEATYTDDTPHYNGEVFLARVLSQRAHAKVVSVDYNEAMTCKGVITYIDSKDIPGNKFITDDELLFATEKVTCVGQVIGAVIAETKDAALKAAQAVKVEYEDLPPIITIEDAIAANSYLCQEKRIERGDVSLGFTASDHIIRSELYIGGQEHFYMEPQVSIALPKGEHGEMEIISSTQWPTFTQLNIANVLGVPHNRITARAKRLGGAFGGKDSGNLSLSCATAVAAHKTGRPVRSVLDRKEDMISTGKRHPFLARCKIGRTTSGNIKALDVQLFVNGGNSMDVSEMIVDNALYHLDNAYFIPNFRGIGRVCKTNTISNTAMRGFGAPQAILIIETLISEIAKTCGLNQTQVREQNLYQEHDLTHLNQKLENCTIQLVWKELLDKSNFQEREIQVNEFNRNNRWRKRGIALNPLKYGIGFGIKRINFGTALVHVYSDGSVLVSHGGVEMGQGLHTKMIQVTSQELGIPLSKIHIKETSTDSVPNTAPTGASVATDINGMAVADACKKIMKRLAPYRRETPQASWEELVKITHADRVSLSATGFYRMPEAGYDLKTNRMNFRYFTFGAACSEVEIDCLTGDHEVLRTDIVMDLGRSLNPGIDIGQIEGAFVQGMGLFTTERLEFTSQGNLLPTGPNTYVIPTMSDIPAEFHVHLLPGVQNPKGLYSSKAVGEPPLMCAVSVYQAIKNAISAAREEVGLSCSFRLDSPATSERIRMSCSPYLADMATYHS